MVDAARPVAGRPHLSRPRLLERVHQRWSRRVVAIVAGAGFGKTTLLHQAMAENQLSPRGRDHYASFEGRRSLARILASLAGPADLGDALEDGAPTAHAVAEWVWAQAPTAVAILLDDLHEVEPDSESHAFVEQLIRRLPENGHLVLAGRRLLSLPLARLTARADLAGVSQEDLRFTSSELEAFAHLRGVDAGRLAKTAGWPALAELAVPATAGTGIDFVREEVLHQLTPPARRGLAVLALLGGLDPEALAAALGPGADALDVDQLVGDVPLVDRAEDGTVKPHSLWADALADEITLDDLDAARTRAAAVFTRRGDHPRAVDLLESARDWAGLKDVVRRTAAAATGAPGPAELARWEGLLARHERNAPERALVRALLTRQRTPSSLEVLPELEAAAHGYRAAGDGGGEAAVLSLIAYHGWRTQDRAVLGAIAGRVVELAQAGNKTAQALSALAGVAAAEASGDAEATLARLDTVPPGALAGDWEWVLIWFRVLALAALGHGQAALQVAERARTLGPASSRHLNLAWHTALWAAGRPAESLARLDEIVPDRGDSAVERFTLWAVRAQGAAKAGWIEMAEAELKEAEAAYPDVQGERAEAHLACAGALIALGRGDEERAAGILATVCDGPRLATGGVAPEVFLWAPLLAVVIPETSSYWDARHPGVAAGLALARARQTGDASALSAVTWGAGEFIAHFGVEMATEFAVALRAASAAHAEDVFDELVDFNPTATREALRRLASRDGAIGRGAADLLVTTPTPPAAPIEIRVLGPAEVLRGGEAVAHPDWRRERVRSLLLLLVDRQSVTREEAVTALWPDLDMESAGSNLRTTLRYLQNVLEPERGPREAAFFVRASGERLRLVETDRLVVDAREMARLLAEAREADAQGTVQAALNLYLEALTWWRGEYLADAPFHEWALARRDTVRSEVVAAAVRAGELLVASGEADAALDLATRAIDSEPWSEPAFRLAVSAHLGRKDRAAAMRMLDRCHEMLAELGVPPEPETEMLERLVRGAEGAA